MNKEENELIGWKIRYLDSDNRLTTHIDMYHVGKYKIVLETECGFIKLYNIEKNHRLCWITKDWLDLIYYYKDQENVFFQEFNNL